MKKKNAIIQAADLAGDCTNAEYLRGMCELLARCFPKADVLTDERAEWFESRIREQAGKGI